MGLLKLKAWYESMLSKAKHQGIVTGWTDMFEHYRDAVRPADLPLFAGDYWVEALARHAEHVHRA
eukprot:CAMPEP_0206006956 /NCGR_PEP_ID=MMETSP1464-20131121/5476_1 /ASSEMBLY_ACC=CAM_ASM_001124 /TAXON_ID=119497 /ORGANISM="Exanthemachrysis gayraliae, Strain RCC1523" /LENGTH=64 /DNA_ID=CAMNT_0053380443 /DNA_START=1 /DNA_END=192 /DNA_ORIENTATION=-